MEQLIKTYRDDDRVTARHFILSDINSAFLQKNAIVGTVEDFKDRVRNSHNYFYVETGNARKGIQHTKVYCIDDFINNKIQKAYTVNVRLSGAPEAVDAMLLQIQQTHTVINCNSTTLVGNKLACKYLDVEVLL